VDRAIGDLGELLRASFESPERDEISLGEELALTERYVHLQSIRFPDRLEVEWRIDPETRLAMVPALLVQPLVENALEHGLATSQGGHIAVAARRNGEALEIEVSDDGPGFRDDRPLPPRSAERNGVGLANARERISLLYGTRASLTCTDRPGGGALVRIQIPWRIATAAERPA
jgi:sensor histidine kinase YesM